MTRGGQIETQSNQPHDRYLQLSSINSPPESCKTEGEATTGENYISFLGSRFFWVPKLYDRLGQPSSSYLLLG
jgi:hypothetical protein